MIFFAYNLLLTLAAPLLLPYALWRGWRRGQPWRRLPERLGFLGRIPNSTAPDSIWLHAVSLGEVLSCSPLLEQLRRRFPSAPLFVSTTTATGQQMALEKLGSVVDGVFYAPLDLFWMVRRALRHLRPRLVIVAETEIWPNLFRQTKRSGAGLLLVNARISDQSASSYQRNRFFFRHVLRFPDRILAQSTTDRDRLIAAGAAPDRVEVNGNFKYDFQPGATELAPEIADLLARLEPQALLVAGSTREDEEGPVIDAFRLVAQSLPGALLVIAPRHPQRFDEVAALLEASDIPHLRRSALTQTRPLDVTLPGILLLDSLGELASLYRAADVVFVGGSLNGWGGHNILEPAFYARPVVVGPHMQNFRAIAETLLAQGGLVQVAGATELGPALLRLIENPAAAAELGQRARKLAESQRGATERAAEACEQLVRQSMPRSSTPLWRRAVLGPLAALWDAVARLRLHAHRRGWLAKRRLDAFTICVGNLTAGGAGKTPLVAWLVEQLSRSGHRPAVLTRGYRRSSSADLILHPRDNIDPADCGDEAVVLLRHFERAGLNGALGIGANRYQVGQRLLSAPSFQGNGELPRSSFSEIRPDLIVLDDGFQHLALERDLDLLLIDVTDPFGGGEMLPLGRLREPLSSLKRAGAILLTRTEPGRSYEDLERRLQRLNPTAPIFRSGTRPLAAVETGSGSELSLASLAGRRIVAFCGLGNPESFWRALRREGLTVVERIAFRDHHRYSPEDVQRIERVAAAHCANLILTTEKDLVNLARASSEVPAQNDAVEGRLLPGGLESRLQNVFSSAPLAWLKIEAVVERGDELLQWIEQRAAGRIPPRDRESAVQGAPV